MILGSERFSGYLGVAAAGHGTNELHFETYAVNIAGTDTIAVYADLYGVRMLTDLDRRRLEDQSSVPQEHVLLVEF
jgi:hypothetical protein